jgi:hypothetical protein
VRSIRLVVAFVVTGFCLWGGVSTASAAFGGPQNGPLSTEPPFPQCEAVYLDPSCGYLVDITPGTPAKLKVISDPAIGFYEGADDVLVGVQNDSGEPVSSIHIGVPGSGTGSFGFDGDGLCTPGGSPVPSECPFGPSVADPFDYQGPDAQLTASSNDDGTVTFPTPLQPGQYTYFSLEAYFENSVFPGGNDFIQTSLNDGAGHVGKRITVPAPVNVTDTATLGPPKAEAEKGKKVKYRLYSDKACTKEIGADGKPIGAGKPAGGEPEVTVTGVLPASTAVGKEFTTNATYYWKAEYEKDKVNDAAESVCGDETMTFGTPPTPATPSISTSLSASNGAQGAQLTVPAGTAVSDTAFVSFGGVPQSGRVSYYLFRDPSCLSQITTVNLGKSVSSTGAYGASAPTVLPLGTYYFQVIYSGNSGVAGGRSPCGAEVLTVVPPPPKPPPCSCAALTAFANKFVVYGPGTTRLIMQLNIALVCTAGVGPGCQGEVVVHAPPGASFIDTVRHPKGVKSFKPTAVLRIKCAGPCNGTTILRPTLTWLALETHKHKRGKKTITKTTPNASFTPHGRAKKNKFVGVELICVGANGALLKSQLNFKIHFNKHGQVDYKRSDLNGDKVKDGKQLFLF